MAYVYGHYKADTGDLFYIGKGTGDRAWEKRNRTFHWKNVVNKHGYRVEILADNLSDIDAYNMERTLIEQVGLENLVNVIHGGIGNTATDEWRQSVSAGLKRKYVEDESYRQHMQSLADAKRTNPEYIRKATERNKVTASKPDFGKKVSAGLRRLIDSDPEAYRKKNSDAQKGKKLSEEHKKKVGDAFRGKVLSEEHKKKISIARKKWWENKKAAAHFVASGYKVTINEQEK